MTTQGHLAPWDVTPASFAEAGDAAGKLMFLLGYAVLAPSGHNTQPWLFDVEGETAGLYADRAQALAVVDPDDRALTISCGAALCNLRVALRRFGYRDDAYELLPEPRDPDLLARIRLAEGEPPSPDEEALFEAIPRRRTTRAAYDEREVPIALRRELEEAAAREGAWLHLVSGDERPTIAELISAGDRVQMADKRFRRELAAWLHPNRSAAGRGMRGYSFGFGDLTSHAGPLVIRTFDIGRGQAARDRGLADRSPLLAVLGTATDTPGSWLQAGQAMERVLLRTCAHGLTSSFLNQPVEVDELRPRLAGAIGREGERPQLVMRFGYGPHVEHSPRVPVHEVLTAAAEGAGRGRSPADAPRPSPRPGASRSQASPSPPRRPGSSRSAEPPTGAPD